MQNNVNSLSVSLFVWFFALVNLHIQRSYGMLKRSVFFQFFSPRASSASCFSTALE